MELKEKLNIELHQIPAIALEQVQNKIDSYQQNAERNGVDIPKHKDFLNTLPKVWCASLFVADSCIRSPALINQLVSSQDLFSAECRHHYAEYLMMQDIDSEAKLMSVLRHFRCREMVRIAWRDLAGWSDLSETLSDLTQLAEVCVQFALDYLYKQACVRRGVPVSSKGREINIVVLGMGKLGAWELNYSSDIDLIFAYAEDGILADRKETTYGEFFSRICRQLVKVLDEMTADGFVFRTDIRLRPFGDSGPVIMTFDGMENYYLTQAREWERYAMIKARQIGGDFDSGKELTAMIRPFVYRRYLDYGAFEELRSLKRQIMQELQRKDRLENIKLGAGGIREIEFIGQAFQLIRGGQEKDLQRREILKILKLLGEKQLLTLEDADQLQASYCFLRRAENHIQQYQDKQTHDLPTTELEQHVLAFSMGYPDWGTFKKALDKVRFDVHQVFEQVFSLADEETVDNNAERVWSNNSERDSLDYLKKNGFKLPEESLKNLQNFKNSQSIGRLTVKGRGVIDRLIPQLVDALPVVENTDQTLKRVLDLFEEVAGRNVYLSLLSENPHALLQLIKLSSASPWICQYLANYPVLFDELLDTRSLYEPLDKNQLRRQLAECVQSVKRDDIEELMIKLRQFKQFNVLRIAAADIMHVIPVRVVSDYLTYVAEVILEQVINIAWKILIAKHGFPPNTSDANMGFAVLGFGKLGGMELGYGSDLDMVFLFHDENANALTNGNKPVTSSQFYGRLGQKIRHVMDTKMLSGILYEVDMRLRPSGDSGLLVTHVNSYENYLKQNAWTWEHQALVRARFVAGSTELKQQYEDIRRRVLRLSRDKQSLKVEVCEMRNKMREALIKKQQEKFDLKQSIGGIVDIEFIVQFLVLAHAVENSELTDFTDNIGLLGKLEQQALIPTHQADILKNAYYSYRDFGHHQALQGMPAMADKDIFAETSVQVEQIWHEILD